MQVVDFQWHPVDPFTMVSVSDAGEGGTLQVGYRGSVWIAAP